MLKITVAGAGGFIGSNLIKKISNSHKVKALSRNLKDKTDRTVEWKIADLFSLTSTQEALKDTDIAIYLIHSMMPSSRLFQGSFHDTDLVLADNFAHACKISGVKQIIYLGGVVPKGSMSQHLESRKEVENILKNTGVPWTIFRAGLVVGNGGSSFEILKNLALNLPAMILPAWTQNITPTIYLDDLTEMIRQSIDNKSFLFQTIDAVCGEPLMYKDLIQQTVRHLRKKSILVPVPINYTSFSKLWVSIFGRSDYSLVSPLIDSLLCDFSQIHPSEVIEDLVFHKTYRSMLAHISTERTPKKGTKRKF